MSHARNILFTVPGGDVWTPFSDDFNGFTGEVGIWFSAIVRAKTPCHVSARVTRNGSVSGPVRELAVGAFFPQTERQLSLETEMTALAPGDAVGIEFKVSGSEPVLLSDARFMVRA